MSLNEHICPLCGEFLQRVEPFYTGVYHFECHNCDIDIFITDNKEIMKEGD